MQTTKIHGSILTYNPDKQIAIIITADNRRFFMHLNQVIVGPPEVKVNDAVRFMVSNKPVQLGRLPVAVQIEILDSAADVLTSNGVAVQK
jgi:hypothetical protein